VISISGVTRRPGEYQELSEEQSDSDFSSCDLEAGDTAKVGRIIVCIDYQIINTKYVYFHPSHTIIKTLATKLVLF
jgi:hypothetical protein